MQDYTHLGLQILGVLSDDKGHPNWEIAKHLNKYESNINPILNKLKNVGAIYQGRIAIQLILNQSDRTNQKYHTILQRI